MSFHFTTSSRSHKRGRKSLNLKKTLKIAILRKLFSVWKGCFQFRSVKQILPLIDRGGQPFNLPNASVGKYSTGLSLNTQSKKLD